MRPLSSRRLARLNRRQRKKLRAGEFQELVFPVHASGVDALDESALDALLDAFIDFAESRGLVIAGASGQPPRALFDGTVAALGRRSVTEDDREAVRTWLQGRREVQDVRVGELVDGWYPAA